MNLKLDTNMQAFLEMVKKCKGEVWFQTEEGDKLNVKSTLSQYIFILMEQDEAKRITGRVECENKEDYKLLAPYLVEK